MKLQPRATKFTCCGGPAVADLILVRSMKPIIVVALVAAALIALTTTEASEQKSPSHATREAAIHLLRQEHILEGKTRVVSATWEDNTHEWLITLRRPSGLLSAWFVDSTAQNYHGGACKH
jgi:hypothetical protein